MKNFCPYFTNDGTLGLFSTSDDDIYHSTYGALTESWQKFILPSNMQEYIKTHNEVKILDICYGIGYNTKTALTVFLKNYKNIKKNSKSKKNKSKETKLTKHNIGAIHTDNISSGKNMDFVNNNSAQNDICTSAIDGDNVLVVKNNNNEYQIANNSESQNNKDESFNCNKILIDAVDLDKSLIYLSPFVTCGMKSSSSLNNYVEINNNLMTNKEKNYFKIFKRNNFKYKIPEYEYRLSNEVNIIIFEKMLEQFPDLFEDKFLKVIFSKKQNSIFWEKYMLKLAYFCSNCRYNLNLKHKICAFLHNIYYRYVSKSYKNAKDSIKNNDISLNFYNSDARDYIKSTSNKYNFIFLDAFAPAKCPALWTVEFFEQLYSRLEDDGMILTYSSSATIRKAFLQNGFYVGKTYDKELKKFTGTIATKNKNLLEYPLDEQDIKLTNSKAGIPYHDNKFNLDNSTIIKNREIEVEQSNLPSSSSVLKGHKKENVKSI